MIRYMKLSGDQGFGVVGPPAEVKLGKVTVTKRDGGTQVETVISISKPFADKFSGQQAVCGKIAPRSGGSSSASSGSSNNNSNTGSPSALKKGDMIKKNGDVYVVTDIVNGKAVACRTVMVTNPSEWELV